MRAVSALQCQVSKDKFCFPKQNFCFPFQEKKDKLFVIRPSKKLEINRLEKDENKLQAVYELGKDDCNNNLNKLYDNMKFLQTNFYEYGEYAICGGRRTDPRNVRR